MNEQDKVKQAVEMIKQRVKEENDKPLTVSIMGQTGVGKSSLLNALFNANLKTDAVKPCTKEIEKVVVRGVNNNEIHFYDLPGIGESETADEKYLQTYLEQLRISDIVLWAIYSDNRSTTFDKNSLESLYSLLSEDEKVSIISKITFVLTKADVLIPPAWVFGKYNDYGLFSPMKQTRELLNMKSSFFQKIFISPYADKLIATTYNDCEFNINDSGFSFDKYTVTYNGVMNEDYLTNLKNTYPKYAKVFERIYMNYEVIPCSSQFKFNLSKLLVVIINKLGKNATGRFSNLISTENVSKVLLDDALKMSNIILMDANSKEVIFDMTNYKF